MKRIKFLMTVFTVCVLLNSCGYESKNVDESSLLAENNQLKSRVEELEKELDNVKNEKLLNSNQEVQKPSQKQQTNSIELKEGEILLYGTPIQGRAPLNKPAYGPIAELNPYAANEEKAIFILSQDEYYTKVKIEGYIPTWYITKDNEDTYLTNVNEDMYVLKDCDLYITPQKKKQLLASTLHRGYALEVQYEYENWYYVSSYSKKDACEVSEGWIEKGKLGYKKDFSSPIDMEVHIKEGSKVYDHNGEIIEDFDDEWSWGRISEETKDRYIINLPGAWSVEVNKADVEFVGEQ